MKTIPWNRTKIVATLGPATRSKAAIRKLVHAGVDVTRLNFSHGTPEEHRATIAAVRRVSAETGRPIAILADLPGPKLRVAGLRERVQLVKGKTVVVTAHPRAGTPGISTTYPTLVRDVKTGDRIYLDDGNLQLVVESKKSDAITCRVTAGGWLKPEAGINVPDRTLSLDFLTPRDRSWIDFAAETGVDLLGLSFVRTARDVARVRSRLEKKGARLFLIAKIEQHEALDNIGDIITVSDGIMVARGDLGVELPVEEVALSQKTIIRECNRLGKPVITATQMLESMVHSPRPTRAEVSDVSNAILDGTDAVMLSEETAMGDFPVEAVSTMARIARCVEATLDYDRLLSQRHTELGSTVTDIMSYAACESALRLKAGAIVTPTRSGATARMVSRYRPQAPIVAATPDRSVLASLCLSWGVYPVLTTTMESAEAMVPLLQYLVRKTAGLKKHDTFIVTGGSAGSPSGHTNFIRVETIRS